jgi:hypothetical protein
MFSNPLPDSDNYIVVISDFAAKHHIKRFTKQYKGKQWLLTLDSIEQALKRVHSLENGQRVDELKHGKDCILFKYDFAVALTNVSAKASGNRCVIFLDSSTHLQTIVYVYGKTDLPKKQSETSHIMSIVEREHPDFWERLN